MPIYQYVCPKCKKEIEVLQRIGDVVPICKKCNIQLKKIISTTSFVLKGDGWGLDGYGKKKKLAKKKG